MREKDRPADRHAGIDRQKQKETESTQTKTRTQKTTKRTALLYVLACPLSSCFLPPRAHDHSNPHAEPVPCSHARVECIYRRSVTENTTPMTAHTTQVNVTSMMTRGTTMTNQQKVTLKNTQKSNLMQWNCVRILARFPPSNLTMPKKKSSLVGLLRHLVSHHVRACVLRLTVCRR